MVYNFATTIQVTLQLGVTLRVVAQGRTIIGAARTACGVVLLMVLSMLTVTTWIVVVGIRITTLARTPIRCAVFHPCLKVVLIKLARAV